MAQDSFAVTLGNTVRLAGKEGPFRSCRWCGSNVGRIGSGVGPHFASVRCDGCGRHLAWLGRKHLEALTSGRIAPQPETMIDDGDSGEAA